MKIEVKTPDTVPDTKSNEYLLLSLQHLADALEDTGSALVNYDTPISLAYADELADARVMIQNWIIALREDQ